MNFYFYADLEYAKNDKVYRLSLPYGAPYAECAEAAREMAAKLEEMVKQAEENAKKMAEENKEEVPVEVVNAQ